MNQEIKTVHATELLQSFMTRKPSLTRQGVRDLNGPALDGRYNGRRHTNCPHLRAPDYPTYREDEVRLVEDVEGNKTSRKVSVYYCSACGHERWVE